MWFNLIRINLHTKYNSKFFAYQGLIKIFNLNIKNQGGVE